MDNNVINIGNCIGCRRFSKVDDGVCTRCLTNPKLGRKWAIMSHRVRTEPEFAARVFQHIRTDSQRKNFLAVYGKEVLPESAWAHSPWEGLEEHARESVSKKWKKPCEDAFLHLLDRFPRSFANFIRTGNMGDQDLTHALYVIRNNSSVWYTNFIVRPLLQHKSPAVRGAALVAVELNDADSNLMLEMLNSIKENDTSPGVRAIAGHVLRHLGA